VEGFVTTTALTAAETESTQHKDRTAKETRAVADPRRGENRSDDEILGLVDTLAQGRSEEADRPLDDYDADELSDATGDTMNADEPGLHADNDAEGRPEGLREVFKGNPKLQQVWDDAKAYREAFPTPDEARQAKALVGDLNRMDALFFSGRSEDHVELARSIAELDPRAFASLARAMTAEAGKHGRENQADARETPPAQDQEQKKEARTSETPQRQANGRLEDPSSAEEFFQTTNAAAVQAVVDAIQIQVERLLPEGASKTTRNRVVGEIYRELDGVLRENRQLAQQVRDAFRAGTLDAGHQRAIVSLISGRARQALPNVAKKVMEEWTSTVLAADRGRRTRQRTAEQRIDIVGSGGAANDGRRGTTPRDIDYSRLSDADILNL
jgi:hypothetical protein